MSPILIAGTIIVNLALVFYSVGIFIEQRRRRVTRVVVGFLTAGVVFDLVATGCIRLAASSAPRRGRGASVAAPVLAGGL